ncbi:hypothetical protein LPY66_18120 [Dehalobacter sp. DCM]|uniref:hypothetical protein n=1 Tax=Dehalobacter sp. DCM TaxID=2907827 RepID=UPI0030812F04|nr:hypothetical protein LPY66_18120 [Dehalobacter sp. DCM]
MRYIILDSANKVIATREGPSIAEGEIQSDIGELGQVMQSDGTFITPEPPPLTFDELKQMKVQEMQLAYQTELTSGFVSNASGESLLYGYNQSDQFNFTKQLNAVNAGIAFYPIMWGTKNSQIVSLNESQYKQLCSDANAFEWGLIGKIRTLAGRVMTATTIQELEGITW